MRLAAVSDPLLQCRGVWFAYDETPPVLRGIDLDIYHGEAIALIGQNGSGKTTLAKHMNGLLHPARGTVRLAGQNTSKTAAGELASVAGYVFQNPDHQIFSISVEQEIAFGPRNLSLSEGEVEERVSDSIHRFRLEEVRDRHPTLLGRGLRRRVAIASAYALRPDLLILDEPTVGLDRGMSDELIDLMRDMTQSGRTVVLISHDMRLVGEFAERLLIMHEGEVIGDGDVHHLLPDRELMRRARLSSPDVTRISQELSHYSEKPAVRLQEFVDQFERLYKQRHPRRCGTPEP
jgi:energy-coupling factor transporter ATP-binding protein EcfA2